MLASDPHKSWVEAVTPSLKEYLKLLLTIPIQNVDST